MEKKKFCKFCGKEIDPSSIVCPKCGRQVQSVKKEKTSQDTPIQKENKQEFYTTTWFMWVMLVFFTPVGIFLMWKFHPEMKKNIKIIISIIFVVIFLIGLVGVITDDNSTKNESEINSNSNTKDSVSQKKVEVIDFSSMQEDEIKTWCNENNINCNITRAYSDSVAKDSFLKQSVPAGNKIESNTGIIITYSQGPAPTKAQENAVKKAKLYLDTMAFSRDGLIKQLEYEGFTNEEAIYGVDNATVDWNEQAVKKAKAYLDTMPFSREGLIDQLEYEGFTTEQATYGVEQNGL